MAVRVPDGLVVGDAKGKPSRGRREVIAVVAGGAAHALNGILGLGRADAFDERCRLFRKAGLVGFRETLFAGVGEDGEDGCEVRGDGREEEEDGLGLHFEVFW